MGKRKTINVTPGAPSRDLATLGSWALVGFSEPGEEIAESLPALPGAFKGKNAKAAPSGLSPVADWTAPGQFLAGIYRGVQTNVSKYKSNLYTIITEEGELVAVWGGPTAGGSNNILDKKIALLKPVDGDQIFIGYLGEVGGGDGKSAARDFHVVIVPKR